MTTHDVSHEALATDGVSPVPSDGGGPERRSSSAPRLLESYALVGLLVAVIVFFSIWPRTSDAFLSGANFRIVLGSQAVLAIVALGALIPLICNEWDLSVGASAALSAVVTAKLLSEGHGVVGAMALGATTAMIVGLLNALLVTRLGTNAVITTLGTSALVAGALNQITGGAAQVSNIPDSLIEFGSGDVLGVPHTFLVMVGIAAVTIYLLEHTPVGRSLYAIGSNREASRLIGLRTLAVVAGSFIFAGALSALAGVLQVARAGGADPRLADALTLPALAAAFLSAAAIKPGRYNVLGTIVALLLLAFINSGLNIAGVPPYVSQYVNGLALIIGVGLAVNLGRGRKAR